MWFFGETENQAKAALQKIEDEKKQSMETNIMAQQQLGEVGQGKDFSGNNNNPDSQQKAFNKAEETAASKQNSTLPIETAGGMTAEMAQPIENIITAEEISQLNYSLSRLASIHREIIIRFYLKEQLQMSLTFLRVKLSGDCLTPKKILKKGSII